MPSTAEAGSQQHAMSVAERGEPDRRTMPPARLDKGTNARSSALWGFSSALLSGWCWRCVRIFLLPLLSLGEQVLEALEPVADQVPERIGAGSTFRHACDHRDKRVDTLEDPWIHARAQAQHLWSRRSALCLAVFFFAVFFLGTLLVLHVDVSFEGRALEELLLRATSNYREIDMTHDQGVDSAHRGSPAPINVSWSVGRCGLDG